MPLKIISVIEKWLSVILIMTALLAQTFYKCFPVLDYQWNKAYIAKYLCVNRNKPEMKCEGKCYLCKKLKEQAAKDQEAPERRIDNGSELICLWTACHLPPAPFSLIPSGYPLYQERISIHYGHPPFIPPRV